MAVQVLGYYTRRKKKLLGELDRTIALMQDSLVTRYGEQDTVTYRRDVLDEFERLIPEIPHISGLRARVFNTFLLVTAQEVAVYNALSHHGKSPAEVWELCHEGLQLRLARIPSWRRWLMRWFVHSGIARMVVERRARHREIHQLGDFEVEYVAGEGDDFDFGVNYRRCGNREFAMKHGAEAFAPYVCLSDIALSDALGWGLIRTQTLADGCECCDFRFKKGASTQISSNVPEVQATIERIKDEASDSS